MERPTLMEERMNKRRNKKWNRRDLIPKKLVFDYDEKKEKEEMFCLLKDATTKTTRN